MADLGNHFDVTKSINVTDPGAVRAEVAKIFLDLYPQSSTDKIEQSFRDLEALYRGKYPSYHSCDTPYHNMQHVLDVTLAMARLMSGYERAGTGGKPLEAELFSLGVVVALFHDCGYVRRLDDTEHCNGAEMTLTHVSRGALFLRGYLSQIGMGELADIAAALIHFTGYEMAVAQIEVSSLLHRLLGCLLGSADIITQVSDRCYLEKCRDRLYPEFVAGGIARKLDANGKEEILFESGEDLVRKTPKFFEAATRRLTDDLGGCYNYAESHFSGQNHYFRQASRNVQFAQAINDGGNIAMLKRIPPQALR